jgi:hypothetical protein
LTRLPLAYRLQPLAVGEVTLARPLVSQVRAADRLLLDAGLLSYGLLCAIARRGAFSCLRVQRPLNRQTQRRLQGPRDRLVRWTPKDSRGRWRREGLPRSLELRRLEYRVPGYRTIQLLTNVRSRRRLSYAAFTRLTTVRGVGERLRPGRYHQRWRGENYFKLLKGLGQQLEHWQQETALAVAKRLLVASMACVVVWEVARGEGKEAERLRTVLVRLSGRQLRRGKSYTEPALLAGLWVLLWMLELLEHYDLEEIRQPARRARPSSQPPDTG